MTQRLEWIDIAKAIAIILMVVGHTSIPLFLSRPIYAFHMPLFFIASGWTTNWTKYSFGTFCVRRFRSLMIPFIIYSAIVLLLQINYGWMTIDKWIIKGWSDGYALWFIPVLFFATVLVRGLYLFREVGGGLLFWTALVLVLCLGVDLNHYHISLPWNISSIPYAMFLIVMGSEGSKFVLRLKRIPNWTVIIAFLVVLFVSHFWRLDMCFNNIIPTSLITIGAFSGTIMVFIVAKFIEKHLKQVAGILISIGRETYIVVAFSQIIIMILNRSFQLNAGIKYFLLVLILVIIKYIKDSINNIFRIKIL